MTFGAGECPKCKGMDLKYGKHWFYDQTVVFPWKCRSCGATGEEVHGLEFIGHENIEESLPKKGRRKR
jgi:hypothetical protein